MLAWGKHQRVKGDFFNFVQKSYLQAESLLIKYLGTAMVVGGILLLHFGLSEITNAQSVVISPDATPTNEWQAASPDEMQRALIVPKAGTINTRAATPTTFDTTALTWAICELYKLMQGSFGGLLTAVSGAGAIIAGAYGQYKAGFGLITVSVGSYGMDTFVSIYFGTFTCT